MVLYLFFLNCLKTSLNAKFFSTGNRKISDILEKHVYAIPKFFIIFLHN